MVGLSIVPRDSNEARQDVHTVDYERIHSVEMDLELQIEVQPHTLIRSNAFIALAHI